MLFALFASLSELLISELSAVTAIERPDKTRPVWRCDNAADEDFSGLLTNTTLLTGDTFEDLKWRGVVVSHFIAVLFQFTVH